MFEGIKGKVEYVVYYNELSKWGVLSVSIPDKSVEDQIPSHFFKDTFSKVITLAGNFEGVYKDCEIIFSGEEKRDSKFGYQVALTALRVSQDLSSAESIINFLTKSAIKGIHIQNASKIYKKFKEESINIVLNEPDKLLEIEGIGKKTLKKVKESAQFFKRIEELINYCTSLGIPYSVIHKLDKELGNRALEVIKNNVYEALDYSENLYFKQIDDIALKSGVDKSDERRALYCLAYTLKNLVTFEGSTGLESQALGKAFYKEMGLNNDGVLYNSTLRKLIKNEKVILENNKVYYKSFYDLEKFIAEVVVSIGSKTVSKGKIKRSVLEEELNNFPFELNEQQINAVKRCLVNNLSVLTGPPGCGKSTIIKALTNIYQRSSFKVVLLSPTGKATRRIEECTGREAFTIHRFLGIKRDSEEFEPKPLKPDTVIIIDESSMLDISIFYKLLLSVNSTTRIILVGDVDQLPSVQAGNILGDLVKSKFINVCRLTDIMRQQKDSHIIKYCSLINKGLILDTCNHSDFHYEEFGRNEELKATLVNTYLKEVNEHGLLNVQVITPYKGGELGSNNLNKLLSERYNFNEVNEEFGYKLEDKIMHLVNDYDKEIFNGEVGTITDITEDNLVVNYPNKVIRYEKEDLDDITLAHAITTHKSQGAEFPVVIVVLEESNNNFLLIRKILYTATSRGKKKVYIFSKPYCVDRCIENNSFKQRLTKLKDFIDNLSSSKD